MLPLRLPSHLAGADLAHKILANAEGILGEIVSIVTRAAVRAVSIGKDAITTDLIDQTGFIAPSRSARRLLGGALRRGRADFSARGMRFSDSSRCGPRERRDSLLGVRSRALQVPGSAR